MSKTSNTLSAGRPSARTNKATTLASLCDDKGTKRVNFDLPADQPTKLKIYASRQGNSIKDFLGEYVKSLPD